MPNDGLNQTPNHAGIFVGVARKLIGRVLWRWLGPVLCCKKLLGGNQVGDYSTALLGGLGSGLVVACANYWFTRKQMDARDRKEFESHRCQRIEDIIARFEDVRINYGRKHDGKPYDREFEVRDGETIALTLIQKDLRLYGSLLSLPFNELLQRQFKIACDLAQAINKDQSTWDAVVAEWEEVSMDLSHSMASEFYNKGITNPSSRRS